MKAGTTSLYHYLREHPQVFMSRPKELNYFTIEQNWDRGIEWYEAQFHDVSRDVLAVGEASTSYSKHPHHNGVPERIGKVMPEVRLLYSIRQPIDRMRSQYVHRVSVGEEKAPIDRALIENPIYVNTSRYAMQIERYLEHFPLDRMLLVSSEALLERRVETMERVYGFVGVDPLLTPAPLEEEFYTTRARRSLRPSVAVMGRLPVARRLWEAMPESLRRAGRRVATKGHDPRGKDMSCETRRRLEDALRDDVARLKDYAWPGFDGWGLI